MFIAHHFAATILFAPVSSTASVLTRIWTILDVTLILWIEYNLLYNLYLLYLLRGLHHLLLCWLHHHWLLSWLVHLLLTWIHLDWLHLLLVALWWLHHLLLHWYALCHFNVLLLWFSHLPNSYFTLIFNKII